MSPAYLPSDGPLVPDFHESDKKLDELVPGDLESDDYSSRCAALLAEFADAPFAGLKILDIGCGRGELVWRLRGLGARAFGVEVEPRYVASGKILNATFDDQFPVLDLASPGAPFPYPDNSFDLVVSFQVLEHVSDLDSLAREVARVLRPGGTTLHVLPAKYRLIEPHYGLPFVHWLPKANVRKRAIAAMLAVGLAAKVLPGHDRRARAESIHAYANGQTFYRTPSAIAAAFAAVGLVSEGGRGARALIRSRLPRLPFTRLLAPMINLLRTSVISARKPQGPDHV